jgi:predicted metal-dependent phosphoesterase TrpH
MIRGDYHLHSEYSFDSTTTIDQLIAHSVAAGLNCIALTDHNTIAGALELRRRAPFRVIIGEEISSADGHIIGLFLEQHVPAGLSVAETVRRIKAQGGLAVAPHPFARIAGSSLREAFLRYFELFDAVEVANSNNLLRVDDRRAAQFAGPDGLPAIGGSDAHLASGIGSNIVEMPDFGSPAEFLTSLRHARIFNRLHSFRYFAEVGTYDLIDRARALVGLPSFIRSPLVARAAAINRNPSTPGALAFPQFERDQLT